MASWNFYIVTEPKLVRLEDMEHALRAVNPDFYIDGDVIVLRGGYQGDMSDDSELECAQVTIEDGSLSTEMLEEFSEVIEDKEKRGQLEEVLNNAQRLVVIQLLNTALWWNNEYERSLAPLQQWLLHNFAGALFVEGGECYDKQGLIP